MSRPAIFDELRKAIENAPDDGPSDALDEADYAPHALPADLADHDERDERDELEPTLLSEFRALCAAHALLHPHEEIRDYFRRAVYFQRVTYRMARVVSPFFMRWRLLETLRTQPLAERTRVEQAVALEIVMGALRLHPYPPAVRIIQANIAQLQAPDELPLVITKIRGELAALDAAHFHKVFLDMMNPVRRWREWDDKAGKYW